MTDRKGLAGRGAVVARPGYHELQLWYPLLRLREEGFDVAVLGGERAEYLGAVGYPVIPDLSFADTAQAAFDVIVVPGTVPGAQAAKAASAKAASAAGYDGLAQIVSRSAIAAAIGDGVRLLEELGDGTGRDGALITAASADDLPQLMTNVLAALAAKEAALS